MKDGDKKSSTPVVIILVVCVVVLLPFLYVLSIGPAYWLFANGYVSGEAFMDIYAPLGFLQQKSEWLRVIIKWYVSLFASRGSS